jgi:hypothetical protein
LIGKIISTWRDFSRGKRFLVLGKRLLHARQSAALISPLFAMHAIMRAIGSPFAPGMMATITAACERI